MMKKNRNIEDSAIIHRFENELMIAKENNRDIENLIQIGIAALEGERNDQKYEWQSNVIVPEYFSSFITESSMVSNQYFQTRDFVEIYLEGNNPDDLNKCQAAKILINKMLNRRELYHYIKMMRASGLMQIAGVVYLLCWWEQEIEYQEDTELVSELMPSEEMPQVVKVPKKFYRTRILKDHFNYEVLDPRNVFVSPEFVYSIQDKQYVIIRHEKDLYSIKADEKRCNYFNLNRLMEMSPPIETESARETYNDSNRKVFPTNLVSPLFDVYERYGKYWAIVKERDNFGNPTKVDVGVDSYGNPLEGAELIECVMTFVRGNGNTVLIRFDPQRNLTALGVPYRPIIRGIYYVHPTKSEGMTDTLHSINLQEAINDTINVSNDRVMLATFPAFKIRKYAVEDISTLTIAPDTPLPLEDPLTDLQELRITDNIQGAMLQTNLLINQLHQLRAIFPNTMGNLGTIKSSMTATAIAGAEQRTDMRQLYKAMCREYTMMADLYWMILQMANQYMQAETALIILGKDYIKYFDPNADYTYKPVTSAVEMEQSKNVKIRNWMQLLQILSTIRSPNVINLVNQIVIEIMKLMGQEYSVFGRQLLTTNQQAPEVQTSGQEGFRTTGQAKAPEEAPVSNQYGLEQNALEQQMRMLGTIIGGGAE